MLGKFAFSAATKLEYSLELITRKYFSSIPSPTPYNVCLVYADADNGANTLAEAYRLFGTIDEVYRAHVDALG